MNSKFDHIEVHVSDIQKYCEFLKAIFEGGSYEVISSSGTSMFTSPELINIEVKKKKNDSLPNGSGFCNPCLRRSDAKKFIEKLGFTISKELSTPEGPVFFFDDSEGVTWHIKDRDQ